MTGQSPRRRRIKRRDRDWTDQQLRNPGADVVPWWRRTL